MLYHYFVPLCCNIMWYNYVAPFCSTILQSHFVKTICYKELSKQPNLVTPTITTTTIRSVGDRLEERKSKEFIDVRTTQKAGQECRRSSTCVAAFIALAKQQSRD